MKLVKHLLEQTKTSEEEQGLEALLLKKVRVTYNKCHTFWRGKVISVHKSDVDKQVDAAKVSAVLCGKWQPHARRRTWGWRYVLDSTAHTASLAASFSLGTLRPSLLCTIKRN